MTMPDLTRDPLINAIHNGIKRGIRVSIDNQSFGSAVLLILSAIDTMAYLGMPPDRQDVIREDFVSWADRYIRFPCEQQVTGLDLYGARCAMLHTYSVRSKLSRQGKCRVIGYMDRAVPEVQYNPSISTTLVMVSVVGLADALFDGINRFLIEVFSDRKRAPVVEARLQTLVQSLPANRAPGDD